MQRAKCDRCNQPAVYHETRVEPSGVVERHFCRIHGEPEWRGALPKTENLTDNERKTRFKDLEQQIKSDPKLQASLEGLYRQLRMLRRGLTFE